MAKVKPTIVGSNQLKSIVDRIEKLEEEKAAIASDIKDVYSEAKGNGFDAKTIRKIVAIRKKDAADRAEEETLLHTYMHALQMDMFDSTDRPVNGEEATA